MADESLVTVTLTASGTQLPEGGDVISVEVRRGFDRIPRAVIVLQDGDPSRQDFPVSGGDAFAPGTEIAVAIGTGLAPSPVFLGQVTGHRVEFSRTTGPRLVVELADAALAMTQARRSRSFTDQTDAEIFETLIGGYPALSPDVAAGGPVQPQVVQHQSTDWDFIVARAEALGQRVTVRDASVAVAAPQARAPAAEVVFGRDVVAADLGLDAEMQIAAVDAGAWAPPDQELAVEETDSAPAAAASGPASASLEIGQTDTLRHAGAVDAAELVALGAGRLQRSRRDALRGEVEIEGRVGIEPGSVVTLTGFGARLSGAAEVTGVCHRVRGGLWTTTLSFGRDSRAHGQRFDGAAPAAAGAMPSASGLQVAVVAALAGDPAGEDRLQLRLPLVTGDAGLVWARHALLDAGDGRGTAFRPEIGDEVVVGFLSGDPRYPVILGALHSSARPTPVGLADDNHEKAIVTRSGMRLAFDDDAVAATVETPGGLVLVLDEGAGEVRLADDKGNSIRLDREGIAIASDGRIEITAARDLGLSGLSLTAEAETQAVLKGGAGIEASSSGVAVLKGSLVQIN